MPNQNARVLEGTKRILERFDELDYFVNSSGETLFIQTSRDLEDEEIQELEELDILGLDVRLENKGTYKNTEYLQFEVRD